LAILSLTHNSQLTLNTNKNNSLFPFKTFLSDYWKKKNTAFHIHIHTPNPRGTAVRHISIQKHLPNIGTPFSDIKMKSSSRDREADAYRNPTELFTLIKNGEPTGRIIQHALKFPQEVMTWIVSRKNSKLGDDKKRDASNDIVWRYLPIHLVCLVQNNPCKELILVMTDLFPKGIKTRDHHGNLPIHYLLAVGCVDVDILDLVLDEEYKCLDKKDGEGRTALEIVEQSNGGEECRRDMIQWFQKRYGQGTKFSPRRNTSARGSYQARECNGNGNGELVENVIRSAKGERKKFLSTIEKLEWDCEAKDQSLDMLAAQLMSVELKLKKERERSSLIERERGIHPNEANEECIRSVKSPLPQTEAVKSLKDTMKIDATIVASQQEKISELDKELDQSRKAEEGAQDKHKKLQSRIDLLDETIRRHDEVVSHARVGNGADGKSEVEEGNGIPKN
jgi:hypothetical protein